MSDPRMSPDELVNFEEEVVQHNAEQDDVAAPASEADALPRPERSSGRVDEIPRTPD